MSNIFKNSKVSSDSINDIQNSLLKEEIKKHGYSFLEGLGVPIDNHWEAEKSFIVFNIQSENAIQLGRRFKQNAIVYGQVEKIAELIYCF